MSARFVKYSAASDVAKAIIASRSIAWAGSDETFTFTSGWKSPVYVNMRGVLGTTLYRNVVIDAACAQLATQLDLSAIDVVVGGETAGIPYAAILADRLNKKFAYVRKAQKGFGLNRLVEGANISDNRVLLVEDLTTDGRSKLAFAKTIRGSGAIIENIFSSFYYGIRNVTEVLFEPEGLSLSFLCEWSDILSEPTLEEILTGEQQAALRTFLSNPPQWSESDV